MMAKVIKLTDNSAVTLLPITDSAYVQHRWKEGETGGTTITSVHDALNNVIDRVDGVHASGSDNQHLSGTGTALASANNSSVAYIDLDGNGGKVGIQGTAGTSATNSIGQADVTISYDTASGQPNNIRIKVSYRDTNTDHYDKITRSFTSGLKIFNVSTAGTATGSTTGDYYVPTATNSGLGVVKSSATGNTSGRDYAVEVKSDGTMKVNVPWKDYDNVLSGAMHMKGGTDKGPASNVAYVDGDTYIYNPTNATVTYTIPAALSINGVAQVLTKGDMFTYSESAKKWTVLENNNEVATSSTLGLVKSTTTGTTADRNYNVEVNSDGTMKVNVPWVNTAIHKVSGTSGKTNDTSTTAVNNPYINTHPTQVASGASPIQLTGLSSTGTGVSSVIVKGVPSTGVITISATYTDTNTHVGTHTLSASGTSNPTISLGGTDSSGSVQFKAGTLTSVTYSSTNGVQVNHTVPTAGSVTATSTKTIDIAKDTYGHVTAVSKVDIATMKPASASAAGTKGFVPAPTAGSQNMVLTGDAKFKTISASQDAHATGLLYKTMNTTEEFTLFDDTKFTGCLVSLATIASPAITVSLCPVFYGEVVDASRPLPTISLNGTTNTPSLDTLTNMLYLDSWSNAAPTSISFGNKSNIKSIKKLKGLDTSKVTNMSNAFYYCSSLTSLDLSSFNTSNVTKMDEMFSGCSALKSLDLSNFNTSKVTRMDDMFYGCSALKSLDLSNFNTSKVTRMDNMFQNCSSLTSLNLSNFNTSNVTDMQYMFYGCSALTSLDLSNWDTSNVTNMRQMFEDCSALTSLDLSNLDTSKVNDMGWMFLNCSSLKDVYITAEATLNKLTNNLTKQGYNYIPSSATIHYNGVDYKWQNNAWTPQS